MSIEIEDFEPEVVANPYAEHVAALAKAGEGKSLTIRVTTTDNPDKPGSAANRHRVKFQKAANDAGFTARVRKVVENEAENETAITFTLGPREARGPRAKMVDEAPETE